MNSIESLACVESYLIIKSLKLLNQKQLREILEARGFKLGRAAISRLVNTLMLGEYGIYVDSLNHCIIYVEEDDGFSSIRPSLSMAA